MPPERRHPYPPPPRSPGHTFTRSHGPTQLAADALSAELVGLFQISRVSHMGRGAGIAFAGRLLHESDSSYEEISRRFRGHGYTPLLRREKEGDVVLALQGLLDEPRTGNPLLNVALFAATVFTTLAAGAMLAGAGDPVRTLLNGRTEVILPMLLAGAPFAFTLLTILGVHEFGHYLAARLHGVAASLPYFIPMPIGGLGTLGAFIAIRSPLKSRTVLFDIGIAGPLAGFILALPLLVLGLMLSFPVPHFDLSHGLTLRVLGQSLLVEALVETFADIPAGRTLALHPIFFAAWFSLLITGINLLPIGQLDGGHVAYGLLGRRAHGLARLTLFALLVAGFTVSFTWFFWAFFVLLGGIRHAPPLNDISGLDPARKLLALAAMALFFLLLVPEPFNF